MIQGWSCAFLRCDFMKQMDDRWHLSFNQLLHMPWFFFLCAQLWIFKLANALPCWGSASLFDKCPAVWEIAHGYWQDMASTQRPRRTGLQSPSTVVLVAVEGNGIRDWHLIDAGLSNSVRLFIYLPGPSHLQLWEATCCLRFDFAWQAVRFRSGLI